MLLALVAESEKAGPTSNPFSRSFGSTDKAAAERTKIVHESGAYSAGAGAGAGAGADPDGMALELPGGRYARGARSPVVARAARNRAGSREAVSVLRARACVCVSVCVCVCVHGWRRWLWLW